MTLDEAIKHCEEIAENLSAEYDCYMNCGEQGEHVERYLKCAVEYRQLAEWLKELKERRTKDVPDTNVGDMVSRQRVIDELKRYFHDEYYQRTSIQDCIDCFIEDILIKLPSAQPESTRTFVELVVRYPDPELCAYKEYKGKPYYSIKYIENGETYVGYGTYNPEVLSQYLKEYFISSVQPEIKPIDYQDCANAMLRMWMDEVVTDGEYNRIMDKLNAFWRTRNERSLI